MWSDLNHNNGTGGFLTPPPPARRNSSASDGKMVPSSASPYCKRDLFHVIHKVPSGDSPYVRAKHVQLIEKDPSRSVSLFWAAINAGDRVDSALKDMAVVMKQLNRADEAIEAIKSFRHLCPYEAQESLDNVLIELYKRSGRMEEEIEMLQHRLKSIEEGIAFGGKRTKIARSQGRKVQITVEQERSRILGNLAWAYLQQHNYGLAEQHYRKALSLEEDNNKLCNLAICLMYMNRIPEAKSLLEDVEASARGGPMDESYSKSFERASETLKEFTSQKQKSDEHVRESATTGPFHTPGPVLYTQPKTSLSLNSNEEDQKKVQWEQNKQQNEVRNLTRELDTNADGDWRKRPLREVAKSPYGKTIVVESQSTHNSAKTISGNAESTKKSWADMVEEEELASFNNENMDTNLQRSPCPKKSHSISLMFGSIGLKEGSFYTPHPSRVPAARRSLCFSDTQKDTNTKRRHRLPVFQDITLSADSP